MGMWEGGSGQETLKSTGDMGGNLTEPATKIFSVTELRNTQLHSPVTRLDLLLCLHPVDVS